MVNKIHQFQGISNIPEIFSLHEIDDVIISPGSRNAPLIKAFKAHGKIRCISVVDERCAGFYALGLSKRKDKPVGLVCTSGTAVLNLAPAIAEAYYQQVSLIVLTADRPPEFIDQEDNQAIRQNEIYSNYIKKSFTFSVETLSEADVWFSDRIISDAINTSRTGKKGPVHVNIPIREPLYVSLPKSSYSIRKIQVDNMKRQSVKLPDNILTAWRNSKRKMVICGLMNPNQVLNDLLIDLAEDPSVIVIAENLANIKGENIISAVDRLFLALDSNHQKDLFPDLVVKIGSDMLSKKAKQLLRKNKPEHNWFINKEYEVIDSFMSLTNIIQSEPVSFFQSLLAEKMEFSGSDYQQKIRTIDDKLEHIQDDFIEHSTFSDIVAIRKTLEKLPENCELHLGNSTPVRYSQLFKQCDPISYYANRGVSGIDGCISTAAGSSLVSNNLSVLIVGDLSFLYDSNALWIKGLSKNLRIVVMNNNGGDVFRILPTNGQIDGIEEYFETPQNVSIEKLVQASGLDYLYANNLQTLDEVLKEFYSHNEKAIVLEIDTRSCPNAETWKQLLDKFKL